MRFRSKRCLIARRNPLRGKTWLVTLRGHRSPGVQRVSPWDLNRLSVALTLGFFLLLLAGCREDMQDQPRLKPLRSSVFLGEQRQRSPVLGTISREQTGTSYFNTGYDGKTLGDRIPFPVTPYFLEHGRERYNIYCAPCHARSGDGNGMIVQRGYRRPPSYHIDRLRQAPLGHFFDVITNGFGAMPDYSSQIPVPDRWAISAYIRVLQFSQNAPANLMPQGKLPPQPPMPGTPGSGATPAQAEPQSGNLEASETLSFINRYGDQQKQGQQKKPEEVESK